MSIACFRLSCEFVGQCCVADETNIHILSIDGIKEEGNQSERGEVETKDADNNFMNVEIQSNGKGRSSIMGSTTAGIAILN